ncbi:hypothetical protein K8R66_02280, partial [bacterium]|nr:hypothetical protein [bacterium]
MNKFFTILLIISLLAPNFNLQASLITEEIFNPSYIISDFELENYDSLDLAEIEYFLDTKNGILKNHILLNPENDQIMTAGEVIYEVAQKYQINPKYLLVLLQKEQSLITDPYPSEKQLNWATGFAICDSCSMNDPRLEKYRGFYNQVFYAAQRNRFYIENSDEKWLFQIDQQYNIDGHSVVPLNQATVNLYNYTTDYNGNRNFWLIWQKWFARRYPNGSILKAQGSPAIWLIEDGQRRPFITWNSFISRYDSQDIREVAYSDLSKYTIGNYIKFI